MMKMIKARLFPSIIGVTLLLFSSCSSRYKNALFTSKFDHIVDTLSSVYVGNPKENNDNIYHIQGGDLIAIRNLQDIEFGTSQPSSETSNIATFKVDEEGNLTLPIVGKVGVSGLTVKQATTRVQEVYEKNLLKNPIIELNIVNLKVTILGEFQRQGNFLLQKEETNLIEILGEAGGLGPKANVQRLKIIRGDRRSPEIIFVNLKNVNSLSSKKLVLQNNDIIYAEPRKIFSTTENMQTFMSVLQPILVLVNTGLIIYNLSR